MAENLGGKFATMSEEERRRFALEQRDLERELPDELAFDDPRSEHHTTRADLEDRDGASAVLDDRQHEERVRAEERKGGRKGRGRA
jgi:hypothetical protein